MFEKENAKILKYENYLYGNKKEAKDTMFPFRNKNIQRGLSIFFIMSEMKTASFMMQ